MRLSLTAGAVSALAFCAALHASILPTLHLDESTIKAFQDYIAGFEKTEFAAFNANGKLYNDDFGGGKRSTFDAGKAVVEPRENKDVASGSIHHFTGVIHLPGNDIEAVRRAMEDYPNYPRYFAPDIKAAAGEIISDTTPADEHYHAKLLMAESTLWMKVGYHTVYDTHYTRPDPNRWVCRSTLLSIKELLDPANANGDTYPEGNDHGFVWKTNTYWFLRQRNGGTDIEVNSITLSRPIPAGFGWWGIKLSRDAVDKMLHDIKAAIDLK